MLWRFPNLMLRKLNMAGIRVPSTIAPFRFERGRKPHLEMIGEQAGQ